MLRLYLLGPFHRDRDGHTVPTGAWARPRDRALLKLLALQRGHSISQARLLALLWPQRDDTAAADRLHVAVSRLRRVLDPDRRAPPGVPLVQRTGAGYLLAADARTWVDAEEFRRLVAQGREWQRRAAWAPAIGAYRAADALWRGEMLEEDGDAPWVVGPRAARVAFDVVRRYPALIANAVLSEPPLTALDPSGGAGFIRQIKPAIDVAVASGGPRAAVDAFFEIVCPGLWRARCQRRAATCPIGPMLPSFSATWACHRMRSHARTWRALTGRAS